MTLVGLLASVVLSPLHAKNPKLEVELVAMAHAARDVRLVPTPDRRIVIRGGPAPLPTIPSPEAVNEITRTNSVRLKAIVDRYGWPGKKLAGEDGAHAAWEVLIAAPDVALHQRSFALMQPMRNQVRKLDFAYLTDVVAVENDQPQTYGTQWTCRSGHLVLTTPVRDRPGVDARRKAVGLPPLGANYLQILHGFSDNKPGCFSRLPRG
ncbi:MAG: hypothetical protein QOJ00_2614 [Actinomycetota bacterium]|jgi:hypothetical protein